MDFAEGAEQPLLREGHTSMRDDMKWQSELAQARVDGAWGALDVYSDGGADVAGTPAASAEYGWLIGGTDEDWRSRPKAQHGWVISLRRWTPPEMSCWVPTQGYTM